MRGLLMSDDRLVEPVDLFGPAPDEQPGGEQPDAPPSEILGIDALDENPAWLLGERPKRTPMLLTLKRLGARGADALGHIGALPRGKVALLVSPGGVGKTALLCQLALAVATGREWLDTFTVRGGAARVVLALGEEDQDEIKGRLWDAAEGLGIRASERDVELVRRNLCVLPLYGRDAKLLGGAPPAPDEAGQVRELEPFGPSATAARWMSEIGAAGDVALIIFDPLSRFIQGDENDNTNATAHITILEQFTKLPGNPTILCAHHTNKGALTPGRSSSQTDARGASSLVDGARWMAVLNKRTPLDGQARATFSVEKTNYTAPLDPIELIRDAHRGWRPCSPSEQPETKKDEKTSGAKKDEQTTQAQAQADAERMEL
jgi:regulatory protein RepA